MHITVDAWVSEMIVEPNATNTGLTIRPEGEVIPKLTLYLGITKGEIEDSRMRINRAVDEILEQRVQEPLVTLP